MKTVLFFLSIVILPLNILAQNLDWQFNANFESSNLETSGMVYHNNHLYVVNDSGNMNVIWQLNPENATFEKAIKIKDVQNNDWEAMAQDENYIYVGDIGNNAGDRTNLEIYKIAKCDLGNNTVEAEIIQFSYADQTSFVPAPEQTDFDAEAMEVIGDNLYIFTKNWTSNSTNVYRVPKIGGNYAAAYVATIQTPGMITGAAYDPTQQSLALLGYDNYLQTFIVKLENVTAGCSFSDTPTVLQTNQSFGEVRQAEAIAFTANNNYKIGTEYFEMTRNGMTITSEASLYTTTLPVSSNVDSNSGRLTLDLKVTPNPATRYISFDLGEDSTRNIKMFNSIGNEMKISQNHDKSLEVSYLAPGVYTLLIDGEKSTYTAKFIKK